MVCDGDWLDFGSETRENETRKTGCPCDPDWPPVRCAKELMSGVSLPRITLEEACGQIQDAPALVRDAALLPGETESKPSV